MELNTIHSEAPALVAQALWVDPSGTSFYAFDGGISYSVSLSERPPPPPSEIWQFIPSGISGDWSLVSPPASSNFTTLIRGYQGTYTYGAGLGFALGGLENAATNEAIDVNSELSFQIPGMVMYNITSQDWYNVSTSGYSQSGGSVNGAAQFVPCFGPAGLLFVFGGSVANEIFPGTDGVSMFDPISQQWSSQEVSGAKPSSVLSPCVVGAQGDNNTYEVKNDRNLKMTKAYDKLQIFLYGGLAEDTSGTVAQGAVYVLSLPAFNWQKQNITPEYGRWLHSCNVIGNRQMVSIGGLVTDMSLQVTNEGPESNGSNSVPDPWTQGLGIFDLTAMEWKEGYDPAAAPYVTPDAVKDYYQRNGRKPASWSSNVVQAWFTEATSDNTDSSSPPSTPHPGSSKPQPGFSTPQSDSLAPQLGPSTLQSGSSTSQPGSSILQSGSSTPQSGLLSSPGSSKNNIGAIAGDTVGGAAALALVALLAFFFLRRYRRKGRLTIPPSDTEYRKPELDDNGINSIPGVNYPLAELQGINDPIEMPGVSYPLAELQGIKDPIEMPAEKASPTELP